MAAKKVRTGAESKALILDTGAKLAAKYGAKNVTRRLVAKTAKVTEPLVTHYVGGAADAQALYVKRAKKMGLSLPTVEEANAIGKKLRAHKPGDARDTRKRSPKEKLAVAKKSAARTSNPGKRAVTATSAVGAAKSKRSEKPKPKQNKSLPGPRENKSAARAPMQAPAAVIPALPDCRDQVAIPPLP